MTELEELSNLSQVALTAERFEDASKYIENLIKNKKDDLTKDEKNVFYNSFKYIINTKRCAWNSANYMEEKENDEEKITIIKNYKNILEIEIFDICKNVISLINNFVANKTILDESKIFFSVPPSSLYDSLSPFLKYWSEIHVRVEPISKTKFISCSGVPTFTGAKLISSRKRTQKNR